MTEFNEISSNKKAFMAFTEETATHTTTNTIKRRTRAVFSFLFGAVSVLVIVVSILAIWINRTITDTATYTNRVSRLANKSEVQEFFVNKLSTELLDGNNYPIQELVYKLLPPEQASSKETEQIKAEIRPIIEEEIRTVVKSPEFRKIWRENNNAIHSQLITQLKGDTETIKLDLRPILEGPIGLLSTTKLAFVVEGFTFSDDAVKATIKGESLENARNIYKTTQRGIILLVAITIIATTLSVFIASNRLKAVHRIVLFTGILSAILALLLSVVDKAITSNNGGNTKLSATIADVAVRDIRMILITTSIICIGVVIGVKICSSKFASKR